MRSIDSPRLSELAQSALKSCHPSPTCRQMERVAKKMADDVEKAAKAKDNDDGDIQFLLEAPLFLPSAMPTPAGQQHEGMQCLQQYEV